MRRSAIVYPNGTTGLGEGTHRPAIEQLQRRLKAAGFNPKNFDGVFDERTRGALEAFQRASAVTVTGRLDGTTWSKLKKTIIDGKLGTGDLAASTSPTAVPSRW